MRAIQSFGRFAAVLAMVAGSVSSLAAQCKCNSIWETHSLGSHYFATASCVRHYDDNYYAYDTCVENRGDRSLDFDWYIPGPDGWIPAGEMASQTRLRGNDDSLERQNGCLHYGNLWTLHDAEFEPHVNDEDALEREGDEGCSAGVGREGRTRVGWANANDGVEFGQSAGRDQTDEIFPLAGLQLRVFAPTNRDRADETMVQIDATVSWANQGDEYIHSLALQASPYGEAFAPGELRLIPEPVWLRSAYFEAYPDTVDSDFGLPISAGQTTFSLDLTAGVQEARTLRDARFVVVTQQGEVVGSLLVPIWERR